MVKRLAVLVFAFVMAMLPVAAVAQTAESDALKAALAELAAAETVEEFQAAKDAVAAALDALKVARPDLDTAALETELANLTTAIDGGDLDEIGGAAVAVNSAGDAVVAAAEEGEGSEGGEGGESGTEPTAVDTGNAVDSGPNVALLAVAGLAALLAGGAFVLRRGTDRS